MSTAGSRFKEVRQYLRLSQEEMGKIFNTTKSYISLVEKDKSKLSAESLEKLLLDYKVNLNYLIGGIGTPFLSTKYDNVKAEIFAEFEKMLQEKGLG